MRARILIVAVLLAAPVLADGPAGPRAATPAPPTLTRKDRDHLAALLREVGPKAKANLAYAPQTLSEARRAADVPGWLKWEAEFEGWFVFGSKSALGGPDEWCGVYFIRKGTKVMGFFRETW